MKAIVMAAVIAIGCMTFFTACERNDYQHPAYRSK